MHKRDVLQQLSEQQLIYDQSRSPMQWTPLKHAGFTVGRRPSCPVGSNYLTANVRVCIHCTPRHVGFIYQSYCVKATKKTFFFSGFPIIWCNRNGFGFLSSTLSCPIRPPPLILRFPYLLRKSFHLVFCLLLHLFPGTGASNILLSTCPSPDKSVTIAFSLIFLGTGASFTDPLACKFLILSS